MSHYIVEGNATFIAENVRVQPSVKHKQLIVSTPYLEYQCLIDKDTTGVPFQYTVTWIIDGDIKHTVTSDGPEVFQNTAIREDGMIDNHLLLGKNVSTE